MKEKDYRRLEKALRKITDLPIEGIVLEIADERFILTIPELPTVASFIRLFFVRKELIAKSLRKGE